MARDKAYREAEEKIEEARRSGATKLDLGHMGLTELPESLGQLTRLQSLELSYNQLTALPEWLGQLTQLQALHINRNHITALPNWLGDIVGLQLLALGDSRGGNPLKEFPPVLHRLKKLDSIWLMSCNLLNFQI